MATRLLCAILILRANTASHKLDTHTYFAYFTTSTQKFVPFHWILLQSKMWMRTSKNWPTENEREKTQNNTHSHTYDIPNSTGIRIFVAHCRLLFSHTGSVAFTHIFLWRWEHKLLSLHLFLCRRVVPFSQWTRKKRESKYSHLWYFTFSLLPFFVGLLPYLSGWIVCVYTLNYYDYMVTGLSSPRSVCTFVTLSTYQPIHTRPITLRDGKTLAIKIFRLIARRLTT